MKRKVVNDIADRRQDILCKISMFGFSHDRASSVQHTVINKAVRIDAAMKMPVRESKNWNGMI